MQILPVSLAAEKEKDAPFLITLLRVLVQPQPLYLAIADQDIFFDGQHYTAFPVEIGAKKTGVDSKIDNVELTISNAGDEFSSALFQSFDFRGKQIQLLEIAYPASITTGEYRYVFVGDMDSPSLDCGKGVFKVTCRAGIPTIPTGRTTMLSCNAVFADPDDCGIAKELTRGIIQSGSNSHTIVIQQIKSDDYWKDGHITVGFETRKIKSSSGNSVKVEYPFLIPVEGQYEISRGCDKSQSTCTKRFNNGANFSGFVAIPWEMTIRS